MTMAGCERTTTCARRCSARLIGSARARCHRSRSNSSERHVERQGSYVLTLERFGQRPLTIGSAYSLPALEDKIIGHVRSVVEQAARAAEGHTR